MKGDFDILESMAKQIWDECRHARYAANVLKGLGGKIEGYKPFPGIVPIYKRANEEAERGDLVSLHAENNLTGEAQTLSAYRGMMDGCQATGKYPELIRISKIVERDEIFHINNGRRVLSRFAKTEDLAKKALEAARYHREAKFSNFQNILLYSSSSKK